MFRPFARFTRAKVNVALHVLGRRADGYHELDSIVAFAALGDRLDFTPAEAFRLTVEGPFAAELTAGGNLITAAHDAACRLAAAHGRNMPGVAVTLTKTLPVASGIGGGSGDAATALRGFAEIAGLWPEDPARSRAMAHAALSLGADVPVCLRATACRMSGVGETIRDLTISLPPAIVLVNPLAAVSTAAVFGGLGLSPGQGHGSAIDEDEPRRWRNDLTEPACRLAPVIADVLTAIAAAGSFSRVAMSGSGATCFGLASSLAMAQDAASSLRTSHPHWWVAAAELA